MVARPPGYVNGFILLMILCKVESHHQDVSRCFHLMEQEYPYEISLFFVIEKYNDESEVRIRRSKFHHKDSRVLS